MTPMRIDTRTMDPRALDPRGLVEPFSLMRNLLRWDPTSDSVMADSRTYLSSFDVFETLEGYRFVADLPGIKREDLDINLTGNRLTISGKREASKAGENETFFIQERPSGSFCRTFNLPDGIDGAGVKADLKDGVLNLLVPKVLEVQPRKIEVQIG